MCAKLSPGNSSARARKKKRNSADACRRKKKPWKKRGIGCSNITREVNAAAGESSSYHAHKEKMLHPLLQLLTDVPSLTMHKWCSGSYLPLKRTPASPCSGHSSLPLFLQCVDAFQHGSFLFPPPIFRFNSSVSLVLSVFWLFTCKLSLQTCFSVFICVHASALHFNGV